MERQRVFNQDWDCLVVIDACRPDYFEEENCIEGDYERAYSRGQATPNWVRNTFISNTDFDYFSCNPYVNSKGIKLSDMTGQPSDNWTATHHFDRIFDLWDSEWNQKEMTVLPHRAVDYFLDNYRGEKSILHLMQPHRPYLTYERVRYKGKSRKIAKGGSRDLHERNDLIEDLWRRLPMFMRINIKRSLGKERTFWESIYEGGDKSRLEEFYRDNLTIALDALRKLVDSFDGNITITSDHAEYLGEFGLFGHPRVYNYDFLHTVPYLEVNDGR